MSRPNRREFLLSAAPFVAAPLLVPALSSYALADQFQGDWRYCDKCFVMFYNGYDDYGHCAAGGGHNPEGYQFFLPWGPNVTDLPNAQINWRYCDKCYAMFYDGYAYKGACPAGGGHHAQGYMFRLPHDVAGDNEHQGGWRYCERCHAMFYDGYSSRGNCAAGGGHHAQGYLFVLPHALAPDLHFRADVTTPGGASIGGWVDLTLRQNGDYTFSGHMHNSGFANLKYSLATVLLTPNGRIYAFDLVGRSVDGTQTIVSRQRDDNWNQSKNDPRIAANWPQIVQSTFHWKFDTYDTAIYDIDKAMVELIMKAVALPAKSVEGYVTFISSL